MRKQIVGAALLSACMLLPQWASAGSLVTDLKLGRPAPEWVGGGLQEAGTGLMHIQSATAVSNDEGGMIRLSRYEASQIQQGLITGDDLTQGCGGASVATGPAGLLPLAVAGLSLLRLRRRSR